MLTFLLSPLAWVLGIAAAAIGLFADQPAYISVTAGLAMFTVVALVLAAARDRGEIEPASVAPVVDPGTGEEMLDVVPGMVWQSDVRAERTFVSRRWIAVTGMTPEDASGRGWLEAVHALDRDLCLSAHRLAATNPEPFELGYRLRTADGSFRLVEDHVCPRFDKTGVCCGFIGLTIDRGPAGEGTRPTNYQSELFRLHETINRRAFELADRYEDLEGAREQAQFSNHVRREFLLALADELRPPIDELGHATGLLASSELTETQQANVDRVQKAVVRLKRLMERADQLGGLDSEEAEQSGQFNLRRLVERVVSRQQHAVEGTTITSVVQDGVPTRVRMDPIRLRGVLIDLLTVAQEHSRSEQIRLQVTRAAQKERRTVVSFAIAFDAGDLEPERLERAFYPVEPLGGEAPGLGLGGCRQVVNALGGQIGVHTPDDGWATLWCKVEVEDLQPHWDGRREHNRLAQELVACTFGPVLDLSPGGMRIRCSKSLEGHVDVVIEDLEEKIDLRAEVAWCRRTGFGKHEAGLRFLNMTPELTAHVGRLATRNRLRQILDAAA